MSFFIRVVFVAIFGLCLVGQDSFAASPEVPITLSSDPSNIFSTVLGVGGATTRVRETCDPEFWDVLKDRAWEEGQREINMNQNLIARPDSVLAMTCFDSFLNHLARYADRNFPGDPDHSEGGAGGTWNELAIDILIFDFGQILGGGGGGGSPGYEIALNASDLAFGSGGDPLLTTGFKMYAVLELLVLDQLVNDVSPLGVFGDVTDMPLCSLERGGDPKLRYLDRNFPDNMIGGRAISESATAGMPSWTRIRTLPSGLNDVNESNYNGCAKMNEVWQRAKCYDFATESDLYRDPPPSGVERDGFYTLNDYATGVDRRYVNDSTADGDNWSAHRCPAPTDDNEPSLDAALEVCRLVEEHGDGSNLPVPIHTIWSLLFPQDSPTWTTAHTGANPVPGAAGALDSYTHFLGLRNPANCGDVTPIKTGYIVDAPNNIQYVDAVCPAPGCYFDPPNSITGTGTCN
ncbi:MAG: hypothetical protein ACRBCK_08720 [Alphaproteobacteria bacterium]